MRERVRGSEGSSETDSARTLGPSNPRTLPLAMTSQRPTDRTPDGPALDVLVIDDEKNIRATVAMCLEGMGCRVTGAASAEAARAALAGRSFDLAFLDLRLGDANGLDLLPDLLAGRPGLAVVIVTAYATIDTAVEAIRRGAADYLPK